MVNKYTYNYLNIGNTNKVTCIFGTIIKIFL